MLTVGKRFVTYKYYYDARLDISANGVWGGQISKNILWCESVQPAHPLQQKPVTCSNIQKHELEKKRAYQQRIQEAEHSSFTPLVLSVTGGMGVEASLFYKHLSSLYSPRNGTSPTIKLYMLVKMSPNLLPPTLSHPSNQRCKIVGTRSQDTHWDIPEKGTCVSPATRSQILMTRSRNKITWCKQWHE